MDPEYENTFKALSELPDGERGIGASLQEIRDAEIILGGRLTGSYQVFLRRIGWLDLARLSVYGLGADVPQFLNLLRNVSFERNEAYPALRQELIPISNDGAGNHYCLSLGTPEREEAPVVIWYHDAPEGANQVVEETDKSFALFLARKLS